MNPLGGTAQGARYALARRGLKEVGASWHGLDPSAEWPSVFGWVFYAYGLGLFGKLGVTAALGTSVAIYIPHVIFSNCWLRQFRFGPVEWLWRTVMYGTWQTFAKV